MSAEHFDVVVIGAGISGIGAGYHLQRNCPGRSYVVLEGREELGGTWDLFRYPGVRSDSDMYTLGYSFRPWREPKAIADGASILRYLRETARAFQVDRHIRFGHRVTRASWSRTDARWTVVAEERKTGRMVLFTCSFLFACTGYYDYETGHTPAFTGVERFRGRIVHPQKWEADIACEGKRVVVIGSGATAVTLVPELAKTAAHVTMLQRSPTYVVSRPAEDGLANWIGDKVSRRLAYAVTRWKNVLFNMYFYRQSKRYPVQVKAWLLSKVREELGPDYDVATHFTPSYAPWDQRVCLVPNGDLFAAIKSGRASVVTDHIDTFTETGIRLRSGAELPADLVITATGLELKAFGGVELEVDGSRVEPGRTVSYKGMMCSDVPNLASFLGYTNASWTLKCDLTGEYVCRLLNYMERKGYRSCTPRVTDASLSTEPWVSFSSGYVKRGIHRFPEQGTKAPWKIHENYALDAFSLKFGSVADREMVFSK